MTNEIIIELKSRGYEAESTVVKKNGLDLNGIAIKNGKFSHIFYTDEFVNNCTVEEIVDKIEETYKKILREDIEIDTKKLLSWDYAKNNLFLCIQPKTNENIVKRNFLDLEQYVRVYASKDRDSNYKVTPKILEKFGITEEELFETAMKQTEKDVEVMDMGKLLSNEFNGDYEEDYEEDIPLELKQLVVTNKDKCYGASTICFYNVLKSIAEEYTSDLIILPSSIHECIIAFGEKENFEDYNYMIREINETQVEPEEVLSDHVYFFNRETCKIEY